MSEPPLYRNQTRGREDLCTGKARERRCSCRVLEEPVLSPVGNESIGDSSSSGFLSQSGRAVLNSLGVLAEPDFDCLHKVYESELTLVGWETNQLGIVGE